MRRSPVKKPCCIRVAVKKGRKKKRKHQSGGIWWLSLI